MTAASRPGTHDARIRELLLLGNSLDFLAEQGVNRGWTRADVLRVVDTSGWELDASGRVPRQQRTPLAAVPAAPAPVAEAPVSKPVPLWTVLVDGRKHPVASIKRRADRLHEQLEKLAADIEASEAERQVRDRLAEIDAERDRLRSELCLRTGKPGRPRKAIEHGSPGGANAHRRRGEDVCAACHDAENEKLAKMRAARGAGQ